MSFRVVTAPAAYPVTRAQAKLWCKAYSDIDTDDSIFDMLIAAMTNQAEHLTGRAFMPRTYEFNLKYFECRTIELPFPPLIDVQQIAYTDIDGNVNIVDPSVYEIDTVQEPGRVQPKWRMFWPTLQGLAYTFNAVRIRYRAGYLAPGSPQDLTDTSALPSELLIWMQSRAASFYDNRSQFVIDSRLVDVQVPRAFADGLLDTLMVGTRFF